MPIKEPTANAAAGAWAGVAVMLSSPAAGDYALIVLGGVAGVMHAVGRVPMSSKTDGVWYVLRWVFTAVMLTGFVSYLLDKYIGFPAGNWPGVVSFFITFFADRWATIGNKVLDGAVDRLASRIGGSK